MNISQGQQRAAGLIVDLVASRLGSDRAVHPETAIASTARLAGSLLLRSFGVEPNEYAPGSILLSVQANEQGPQLINILTSAIQGMGLALDQNKLGGADTMRGQAPELTVVGSLDLLQDDAVRIATECRLRFDEAAQAAAIATAFVVKECARDIGGEVSFNVAVYGFIEGSKTVPPLLQSEVAKPETRKPWYKLW